ncbi:hypothetical protein H0H87_004755 [Tephrocybe sp. NHM501043]|nr:hypothetical protein H0H87_004755 [Tephrocybe sp. NHM501043]
MPDLRTPIGARAPASAIFEPSYIEPNTSHDQSKFSTSQTPTVVGSSDGAFILKGIGSSTMTASDGCSGHNLGPIESPAMRKFNFSHFQRSPSAQAIPINSDVVVTEGSEERHAEGPGARSLHNLSSQASPNTGIPSTTHITGHAVEHMKIPPDSSNALNPPTSTVLSSRALEDLLRSIKSLNFPSLSGISNRSSASAMSPSQLRDLLLPTLAKNAQRRPGFNDLPITKRTPRLPSDAVTPSRGLVLLFPLRILSYRGTTDLQFLAELTRRLPIIVAHDLQTFREPRFPRKMTHSSKGHQHLSAEGHLCTCVPLTGHAPHIPLLKKFLSPANLAYFQTAFPKHLYHQKTTNHAALLHLLAGVLCIETGAMPVLNDEKKKQPPSSAKVPPIKREPDDEDFVTALHPSSAVPPSASLIPAITTFVSHHDNAPPCPAPSSPADTSMEKASPIGPAAPMVQVPASDFAPTSQIQSPIIAYPATETLARSPNQLSHAPAETPSASLVIPASPLPPRVPLTLSATSPPPDISTSRPSFALPSQRTPPHSTMAIETMPCHNIPGLWLMQVGHEQADVVDCEFEVDSEIAEKWHLSGESTDSLDSTERLSLRLLCLPKELAQDFYQMGAIPKPDALVSVPTTWPEQGSLIVQMNPTKPYRQCWLPEHMGPTSPGIDMTNYVRQGTNVLRLIQLDDMTDKIFVLQAELLPPPEEQSLSAFWHAATHNLSDPVWNLLPATVEVM